MHLGKVRETLLSMFGGEMVVGTEAEGNEQYCSNQVGGLIICYSFVIAFVIVVKDIFGLFYSLLFTETNLRPSTPH